MKTILFLFLLLCCNGLVYTQYSFTLRIINTDGQPMKNVEVTAQNDTDILKAKTDVNGSVSFTLTKPGVYTFSYLDMKNDVSCEVKEGMKGTFNRTTTYDPEGVFAIKPKNDRKGITFKTVAGQQLRGQENVAKVTIEVKEKSGVKVPGVKLDLVSCLDKTKYQATSNGVGQAIFYVPQNKEYEVDVDGVEAYHQFKVLNYSGLEMHEVVFYEKTKIREITKGDTIIQNQITQTAGTSSHLLFTLNLKDYNGNPLANEPVYMDAQNSKRVYEGKTDEKGVCVFMLEKGTNYLLNLKYEREIYLADATNTMGFASAMATRRYRGSDAIEKMLAERKMNEAGFVVNHSETPVRPLPKPVNYIKKTEQGFDIDFGTSGPVGTPTIVENKLYSQAGFHSPDFYCMQANTGQYLWGVELGESGASPAVYHNGVLLINTYSCTLYALDALTGKLLWSKWLAGTIYSTPSADDNSVYVVYNNGGNNPLNDTEDYVIASFDLRSGKVNWMKWIDREVIACPVVESNEVHVASQSGNYYVFDKEKGDLLHSSKDIHAVSSPTITKDKIFITGTVNGKEQLLVLNRNNLSIVKKYATQLKPSKISEANGSYGQMNFNGAHPIVYKNEVIILLDKDKIVAFDATSEKMLWEKPVITDPNQMPIVVNDKVVVATEGGDVISYDINTGTPKILQHSKGEIEGQPISHNGFMYIASAGVLSVIKSLQNFQHFQWNRNAGHNAVWE